MTLTSEDNKIDIRYVVVTGISIVFTWVLHEFAHWSTGELLGYKMSMTLNKAFPVNGKYSSDSHYLIISAAGPLITLVEALIVFLIMRYSRRIILYSILFSCFYMRFIAMILNIINLNDEGRISKSLGLGTFTLPVIMCAILFLLVYKISVLYGLKIKFILINIGLVIFFSSVIILTDQYFNIRLI
jgi:hypothetical protein